MFNTNGSKPQMWMVTILLISLTLFAAACSSNETKVSPATTVPESAQSSPTLAPAPTQSAENTQDLLQAAETFFAEGAYDKAISELAKAVALEPDNADIYTNLALSYFKNGDYEDAVAAWTEVIGITADAAGPYYERGTSYFNLEQYEPAIDDLTQAIDLDPTNADFHRARGKSYAFLEEYDLAIADFSQTIALDPTSDEAYFNRAASITKIGNSMKDLESVIADYAMVLQISKNPDLRQQAQQSLETLLKNTDDPALRQQAVKALQGEGISADASEIGAEPSLMDIDVDRAPGHSIGLENSLQPGDAHTFLLLASPDDTIGASLTSSSDLLIGIRNAATGQVLGAVPANSTPLFVTIPENALYHIVIEDAGGQGGAYVASFEASPKVSFALDPNYFMIGRLPEGGLLYYTYSATAGSTLQGNIIPHPNTPLDLVVKILDLESQATLFEVNQAGPGENEQFAYTVPDDDDGKLQTFIVSVEDIDKQKGAYLLSVASSLSTIGAPAAAPESIVQTIFDAAQSGDFASLESLCDPLGENDEDTQMICDLAADTTNREEFSQYFASGKISGDAKISPDGTEAEVPFLFGPDGDGEENMELINRDGQWYLSGF